MAEGCFSSFCFSALKGRKAFLNWVLESWACIGVNLSFIIQSSNFFGVSSFVSSILTFNFFRFVRVIWGLTPACVACPAIAQDAAVKNLKRSLGKHEREGTFYLFEFEFVPVRQWDTIFMHSIQVHTQLRWWRCPTSESSLGLLVWSGLIMDGRGSIEFLLGPSLNTCKG